MLGVREQEGETFETSSLDSDDVSLSVIIPAFNEAASIGVTINGIHESLRNVQIRAEVVVVDDGSTDETASLAERAGAIVICHPANGGYGRALKTGISACSSAWVAIIDADGTYPQAALPKLLEFVPAFEMVVGARTGPHFRGSFLKWCGRVALKRMVLFVTGCDVPDVNSGLRVFKRDFVIKNI